MPQAFTTVLSTPEPLTPIGGVASTTLQVLAPLTLPWGGGTPDVIPRDFAITTLEAGASVVDTSVNIWLVIGIQGTNTIRLCLESDFSNLDTLTGSATWAPLYRLQLGRCDVYQQS